MRKIDRQISSCRLCPLWKGTRNPVPGEGPSGAEIMFVGEAPGRQEDLNGRPFVGRAGRLLDLLFEKSGIERKKVFITSVIKHRPPLNRKPKSGELKACSFWWKKQMELINPETVVLLGRVACDTVLGVNFWKKRGKVFKKNGRAYFITYHPAAGLRFLKFKKRMEKDFKNLSKTLGLTKKKTR